MSATSVRLVDELPKVRGHEYAGRSDFYNHFDFERMHALGVIRLGPNEDWLGTEPPDLFKSFGDKCDAFTITHKALESDDLVFVHDGTEPNSPARTAHDEEHRTYSREPIEQTDAWAVYMQQTGRMG